MVGCPPEDIALCPQIEYRFADGAEYDVRLYDGLTEGTTYLLSADEKGPFSLAEVNRLGGGHKDA